MTLQEKNLIKQLNERILTQSVVIQTLVDILVERGVILERELDERLIENTEVLNQQIEELHQSKDDGEEQFEFTTYYGPIGEC
jgi:mannitol/fructose-specific phosphotransferase system IIA component (Ntr-type)